LLFSDNFDDSAKSLDEYTADNHEKWFAGNEYHIRVMKEGLMTWDEYEPEYRDFAAKVSGRASRQDDCWQWGLILRQKDADNYYHFEIHSDGHYRLHKQLDDEWETIVPWTRSSAIAGGSNSNILQVVCRGQKIDLHVNGQYLETAHDSSFSSGQVGVAAGTCSDTDTVEIAFNNLSVRAVPDSNDTPRPTQRPPTPEPTSRPRPTATSKPPFSVALVRALYEKWGRPQGCNGCCGPYDDGDPVRRFSYELIVTNNSQQTMQELAEYQQAASGEWTERCIYVDGDIENLAPGQSQRVTYVTYVETGDWVQKVVLEALDHRIPLCFNAAAEQVGCP
jgi:hypothetical protein